MFGGEVAVAGAANAVEEFNFGKQRSLKCDVIAHLGAPAVIATRDLSSR